MIVIFEQDTRKHDGRRWTWKPGLFRSVFDGRPTWRVWWGLWSLSVYSSPGLREFFRFVESEQSEWRDG